MPDDPAIRFEPVRAEHLPMLRRWLEKPHMREWWGETEEELGFIRDMVEGKDSTRPFLIMLEGAPVGYIQYWFIGHHQNADWIKDNPWLAELPSDAVGIDLSIGDPEKLSQGIGSRALSAFVRKLRDDGIETIIIDPSPDNARAVRAYRKAGFRPIPELEGRTGDVLIMQYDLNTDEKTI